MLYLLMFLQIGAMFYALRLHRRRQLFANMIPAAIAVHIFGIGVAFVAVLKIILIFSSSSGSHEQIAKEANTEAVAMWYTGRKLVQQYPGETLVVIKAPDLAADANQKVRIQGLEEGIAGGMNIVYVDIEYRKPKRRDKLPKYTNNNLNKLLKNHSNADVILSLIGLPEKYYKMPVWNKDLPDLYSYRGNPWDVDLYIKDDILKGFITLNSKNKFIGSDENKVEKSDEFFEKYFIYVTKDNVEEMFKAHRRLFLRPEGYEEY